jgi:hypothetical protein
MKTQNALRLYNNAEFMIKRKYPEISAIKRAEKINQFLGGLYGEDIADEIIDFVFAHEFYPASLNNNE